MTRLERLQAALERPLLVTGEENVFYLSGFRGPDAALLVERERARLYTDPRYTAAARGLPGIELVEIGRDLYTELAPLLEGEVAFEPERLTVASYEKLASGPATLFPANAPVEALRAVKDDGELEKIRRAGRIVSEAIERLAAEPFAGRSERELAWRLSELFHQLGAERESFSTIVASGPQGAIPHAETGERVVREGEFVVVDAGAVVEGYCSDCTRTFAVGEPPSELRRAYEVCLEAQKRGLAALHAGALAREVDAAARVVIEASEFAGRFGHGLGHGVGLEIHEAPVLNERAAERIVEAGNVVTVEPGIYLEGLGGVRIEDLVAVGEDGIEVLTTAPRELVRVG
jgi:Xaa-Pro aminopeptidase